ncbi:BolA family protein [Gilvimarinus sp. F26214L]|uniref:BolA family protein n=1 Tax=Gilvimarinus sp. DZF01 TaxID=3461371 RepID=UPI0040462756
MEAGEIQALLKTHIPDSESRVQVDGSHVSVAVVSARFEGLNTVKKQQLVYGALNEAIADGRIHAVHMKTFTPAEWQQAQS